MYQVAFSSSSTNAYCASNQPHSHSFSTNKSICGTSPYGTMQIHRQQEPHWLWRFKRREEKLGRILKSLQRSEIDTISDKKLQHCGIQLHPLDFKTGATSPSVTTYFTPTTDKLMTKQPVPIFFKNQFIKCCLPTLDQLDSLTQSERDRDLRNKLGRVFEDYRIVANKYRTIPGLKSFK